MMPDTAAAPVWLITGCSSGFGHELVRAALTRGFCVAATARDPGALGWLADRPADRVLTVALDVTEAEQVRSAVRQTEQHFGRIDVLVNNAGYGYLAAVEEGEPDEIRALFETNFFGMSAMIRAVLPAMRSRRCGTIVNITSVDGLVGVAGAGYYAASAFAAVGLSESLARELEPLGIRVLIVEPGPLRTNWAGRSLKQSADFIFDYEPTAGHHRRETVARSGHQPGDPARSAESVIQAVLAEKPPEHLVLGRHGYWLVEHQLRSQLRQLHAWRELTVSADFPEMPPPRRDAPDVYIPPVTR